MPTPTRPNPNSLRYTLFKFNCAVESFLRALSSSGRTEQYHRDQGSYTRGEEGAAGGAHKPAPSFQSALAVARETFYKPLTSTMYIAGPAMQPGLNRGHSRDHESMERLVVRSIPFAGSHNVFVGDVVAFYNPLARHDEHNVMIRRVAASEGQEMEVGGGSSSRNAEGEGAQGSGPFGLGRLQGPKGPAGLPPFGGKHSPFGADEPDGSVVTIPEGHCWVLADNPELGPPDVIDSRTFGYVPYKNIVGRVIYAAASTADHGPVQNNPESMNTDEPLIEGEVDVEKLFQDEEDDEDEDVEEEEARVGEAASKKEGKKKEEKQ